MKLNRKYNPKKDEVINLHPENNDWTEIKKDELTYFSCCDCGLAHSISAKVKDKKIFLAFERDDIFSERNRRVKKYIKK